MKFNEIVGQTAAKDRIQFYIEAYRSGQPFPSMIACGPRGNGKTELMQSTAVLLKETSEGQAKRAMEVNCAGIKNLKAFWNSVIIPNVNDKDVTLFLDEAHKLPHDVTAALLTMTNPNVHNRNSYTYDDFTVDIDLYRQTFLYATTEPQKVFHALLNRCRRIDLEDYTFPELGTILKRNAPGISISPSLLNDEIAPVLRGNAREGTLLAKDIMSYLSPTKRNHFTFDDWEQLKKRLNINPLGLTPLEIKLLRTLAERQSASLTRLGAVMMMTPDSVRKDIETHLLRCNLIEIGQGSGRSLTPKGHEYVKQYNLNRP